MWKFFSNLLVDVKKIHNYMSTGHVIIPQETSCKGCNVFNHQSFSPVLFWSALITPLKRLHRISKICWDQKWYVHNSWKLWFHYFSGKCWPFWTANFGHIPVLNIVVNSLSVELLLNHCTDIKLCRFFTQCLYYQEITMIQLHCIFLRILALLILIYCC